MANNKINRARETKIADARDSFAVYQGHLAAAAERPSADPPSITLDASLVPSRLRAWSTSLYFGVTCPGIVFAWF